MALLGLMLFGVSAQAQPRDDLSNGSVTATGSTTPRSLADWASDRVNVKAWGAKGDAQIVNGVWTGTDDTPFIANSYAYALANHKALYFPGSAGAYLTATGNPLGNVNGPLTIIGDGMDVSRIIWVLDETLGSLGPIVSGGFGYVIGDILTVQGGIYGTAAMQIKVMGVTSPGGAITQATAWGTANYSSLPASPASVTGGAGSGATFSIFSGGTAIGSLWRGDAATRPTGLTIDGISVVGQGQQNPGTSSCGKMAITIYSFNEITIRNSGVDYSRCMSIAVRNSGATTINGNRVRWSSRDMINASSAWTQITNNRLEHGGDDAIATPSYVAESNDTIPVREGVVIADNFITDAQGIVSLGSVAVAITGNTLVRPKLRAINVSTGRGNGEGATPTRSVAITGNIITDILTVTGDPISWGLTNCIVIGSTPTAIGRAPAIPGTNVAGTGEFVHPFPYMAQLTTSTSSPMPGGLSVTITGNSCIRTLDASPTGATTPIQFSNLGLGLIYSASGWRDFSLFQDNVAASMGINFEQGTLIGVLIQGNTFSGLTDAVHIASGVVLRDVYIRGNIFRDITTYGMDFMSPVSAKQRIVVDENLFDGDPYFTSPSRAKAGTAADGKPTFSGMWSGSYPIWLFQAPGGITLRKNQIRNFALPWQTGGQPAPIIGDGNKVYGTYSPVSAYSIGVGGMSRITDPAFEFVPTDASPVSDFYDQILGTSTYRTAAAVPGTVTSTSIAPSGGVSAISLGGTGQYTFWPTCTIAAPTVGRQAKCHASAFGLSTLNLMNGGLGYTVGNILYPVSGSCSVAAAAHVTAVDANGTITALAPWAAGTCQVPPFGNATPMLGGSGTGASVKLFWYISGTTIDDPGTGYNVDTPPALAIQFGNINAYGNVTVTNTLTLGTAGSGGGPVVSAGAMIDGSGVRQTLTSTYTVPANTSLVRFVQTGTLAASTVALPVALADGQPIQFVNYGGSVSALTFSPTVNGWTNGSTLAANTGLRIRWDAMSAAWQREQ